MNEQSQTATELAQAICQAAYGLWRAAQALVTITGSDEAHACMWMLHEVAHRAFELAKELEQGYVTLGDTSVNATLDVTAAIGEVARGLKGMAWVATRMGGGVNYVQFANALEYTSKRAEELEQWLQRNAAKSFEDK